MDCMLLHLLGFITVFLCTTASVDNACTGVTCSTTPPGECDITCREGDLKTILPDGPLRNLPGSVRNLSLLMDNRNRRSTPTAIIAWRAPTDVHLSVYEVYVYTWNHTALPKASIGHRYKYVVNTANTSHLDTVELRVTSSLFRADITITVFVNTWVGGKDSCFLRQAKAKFHTMGSLQFPTKRWNYRVSVSLRDKNSLSVGFDPFPNATLHDIRLCLRNIYKSRNMGCQTQTAPRGQNTTTFTHSKTCATYRIKIIPSPNPYREMYQVDRFVPALHCLVCEHRNDGVTTSALRQQEDSEVKASLSVQSIAWSAIAALMGLAIGIVFIVMRHRTKQRSLYQKQVSDEDTSGDTIAEQFREELQKAKSKTVCLLYTEDSQCHVKVVEAFVRCLQMYFKCDITTLNLGQDIQHQLRTQHSDIAILVDSVGLDNTLNAKIATRRSSVCCSMDPSLVPHSDLRTIHELLKHVWNDKVLTVRFPHTNMKTSKHKDFGLIYAIPTNFYDLVCSVHDFSINVNNASLKLCSDVLVTVDLRSAIREANIWCLTSSCISLSDDDAHGFSPPDRDSVFDNLTSVSRELLNITREYEMRYNDQAGDENQTSLL